MEASASLSRTLKTNMQFGVSTFLWVSPFDTHNFHLVQHVKALGFDLIEIPVEDKDLVDWPRLKEEINRVGLAVTISGAFGASRDISSFDPAVRANGLTYIKDCVEIASRMGSPIFGGPLYSAVGKTRFISEDQKMQEMEWCVQGLKEAASFAADHGVVLGLEPLNRFESDMVNTVDQALAILDLVDNPNLKVQMDTFHANIEEKNIGASIRKIGKERLCHVQANESDRGTPGTGNLDWAGMRTALQDIGYDGAFVIETFGSVSEEIAKATCIWRPLAESSDSLASEGLQFFRSHF